MKKLHHPGTPCKIQTKKNIPFKVEGDNLEVVKCSEGWGLFGDKEYWIEDKEKEELEKKKEITFFSPERINFLDWGFYSPINLEIELTKKCNQKCIHCWNKSGESISLSGRKLEQIIDEFRFYGGQKIKLTGGEPLMYGDFFKILEYSKNKGVRNIELTTNGSLISKENISYLKEYVDFINISLHGAKKETQNKITQTDNYSKTINAIELCRFNGLKPIINFTVMKENESEISELFKLGESIDSKIRFNLLVQSGSGKNLEDISNMVYGIRNKIHNLSKEYDVALERSGLYPEGYNKDIDSSKFYGCSALRSGMYISAEGFILPCNQAKKQIGNIYNENLKDIWRSEKAEEVRKITSCKERDLGFSCSGPCKASKI